MDLDTLTARERRVALFERYGALLSDRQHRVCDLHLRQDWSLAEIAVHQRTSRAAVHDLIKRSLQSFEDYEAKLGLLGQADQERTSREALARELGLLRRRLARLEAQLA